MLEEADKAAKQIIDARDDHNQTILYILSDNQKS